MLDKSQAINMGARCEACPLKDAPGPVLEPSNSQAKFIIVGEAPGYEEISRGLPFVGPSGQLLNAMLQEVGLSRSDVHCTNTVLCQPKDGPPSQAAIECCRPRLQRELAEHRTSNLISMGAVARDTLLGGPHSKGILATRGEWLGVSGYEADYFLNTIHPAYVLRNPDAARDLLFDLRKAQATYVHVSKPELVVCDELPDIKDGDVTFDIEATGLDWQKDVVLCLALGFSAHPNTVYIVPGDKLTDVGWPVWSNLTTIAHNGKFDQKFLKHQLGWNVKLDDDTMLMHYVIDERKTGHGLKELARVYLNAPDYEAEVRQYVGKDGGMGNVPLDKLYEYAAWDIVYTQRLAAMLKADLLDQNLYDWPYKQVVMPFANAAVDMELAGMAVDLPYIDEASVQFDTKLAELQKELGDAFNRLTGFDSRLGANARATKGDGPRPEAYYDN